MLNIRGEFKLELAANRAESENQVELVPGPDPYQKTNFKFFFQKIKSATMPVHHVKGQPAASTYVLEKRGISFYSNCVTPCSSIDQI